MEDGSEEMVSCYSHKYYSDSSIKAKRCSFSWSSSVSSHKSTGYNFNLNEHVNADFSNLCLLAYNFVLRADFVFFCTWGLVQDLFTLKFYISHI